jgi:hypothetical protein
MAYPSDSKPRRRKLAVPTLPQMIKRRAASPGGVVRNNGVGLMGKPMVDGGVPVRRRVGWNGALVPPGRALGLTGNLPGQTTNQHTLPGGSAPGPVFGNQQEPAPGPQGGPVGGQPGPVTQINPNAFMKDTYEGPRNPLEHLDWWSQHGWEYNKNTGRFRYVGGGDQSGGGGGGGGIPTLPGRPPGQGGGGGTPPPGGGGGGGDANGDGIPDNLPLDAYFEAQRRQLNDALMARLGYINPQREQVGADRALQEARLSTNEGVDTNRLLEQLASRGAFGGGVQVRDQGYLGTDYLRQRQDLASQVAQAMSGLSQQESEAQSQYSQGLMEALLALAQRQAASQYAVTPNS